MQIEQAVYGDQDVGGYRFLARSPGFVEAWLPSAERLCTSFGERPVGVVCPLAVFAQPLGVKHVAVIQAADQGSDDAGRPGALAFRLLVLPRTLYVALEGDPFRIAEAFPPTWEARGELATLTWTAGPPPRRTVAEIRSILDVEAARTVLLIGDPSNLTGKLSPALGAAADHTALLLGGAQALVDGGRLVIRRNAPDPTLAQQLWALLPTATRCEIWPASFAFGNKHAFHLAIVPEAAVDDFGNYVKEAEAGDYPEGRYELALQRAAESMDQAELDGLLARPSRRQRFKLLLVLLALFALVPIILELPIGPAAPKPIDAPVEKQPVESRPIAALQLPEEVPLAAKDPRRRELRDGLNRVARKFGVEQTLELTDPDLVELLGKLDRKIDEKVPAHKVTDLSTLTEPRRVLRAILWKQGVAVYAEPALTVAELVERLENALHEAKLFEKEDR